MALKSKKRSWTNEDDEIIKQHIARGGSAARAAVILKRTEGTVRARASELGLRFPYIRELRSRALGTPAPEWSRP